MLYFSERTCTTAVNPGGNGPETSDEFASDLGNADSPRMVDGHIKQGTENDSLSSTSKQGSEGGNRRSEVRQRQRTFSGPVMYSGTRSSSLIERGYIIDMYVRQFLVTCYILFDLLHIKNIRKKIKSTLICLHSYYRTAVKFFLINLQVLRGSVYKS